MEHMKRGSVALRFFPQRSTETTDWTFNKSLQIFKLNWKLSICTLLEEFKSVKLKHYEIEDRQNNNNNSKFFDLSGFQA